MTETNDQSSASNLTEDANEKKTCPFCAEKIQAQAIKCRFCNSDLRAQVTKVSPALPDSERVGSLANISAISALCLSGFAFIGAPIVASLVGPVALILSLVGLLKGGHKILTLAALFVSLFVCYNGYLQDKFTPVSSSDDKTNGAPAANPGLLVDKDFAHFGENGDVVVHVDRIQNYTKLAGHKASPGAEFIAITYSARNDGKQVTEIKHLGFGVKLSNGTVYRPEVEVTQHHAMDKNIEYYLETLQPGLSKDAVIAFEIPTAVMVSQDPVFILSEYGVIEGRIRLVDGSVVPDPNAAPVTPAITSQTPASTETTPVRVIQTPPVDAKPDDIVKLLYKEHDKKGIFSSDEKENRANLPKFFDSSLSEILTQACSDGTIDFDPLYETNAETSISNLSASAPSYDKDQAIVQVDFSNHGKPYHKTFFLKNFPAQGGWRIVEVIDGADHTFHWTLFNVHGE